MKLFRSVSSIIFSLAALAAVLNLSTACDLPPEPCNQTKEKSYIYSSPGPDGNWQTTADNKMDLYTVHNFDCNKNLLKLESYEPGPDGSESGDDVLYESAEYTYNSNNKAISELRKTKLSEFFTTNEYDNEKLLLYKTYFSKGTDGNWNTSDDVLGMITKFHYDSNGNIFKWEVFINPGADGIWSTNDDVLSQISYFTYDERGNMLTQICENPQNNLSSAFTYSFDINNFITETSWFTSNSNGIWFDGDDVKDRTISSNIENNIQTLTAYNGSGAIVKKYTAIYDSINSINPDKVTCIINLYAMRAFFPQ